MPRTIRTYNGLRVCSKCNTPKTPDNFYKSDRTTDGCQSKCLECCAAYAKTRPKQVYKPKISNKPKVIIVPMSPEEKKRKKKEYVARKMAAMTPEQLAEVRQKQKEYREANKEKNREYKRLYQIANSKKLSAISKAYAEKHREEVKEYKRSYNTRRKILRKHRSENDEMFRITTNLRNGVARAFKGKGWGKKGTSQELLGADYVTVKKYIERQFKPGMSWKNNTPLGWHIDHKVPLSSAKNIEELKVLCHFTNLQPLWWKDNILKQDKIIEHQLKLAI